MVLVRGEDEDFAKLARDFPRTTFIFAHWGGLLPLRDATIREQKNIFYDTAASPLLYDAGIWGRFAGAVGAGQVLFGSDFPLNLYPQLEANAEMTRLLAEAKNAGASSDVLGLNAARLLRC